MRTNELQDDATVKQKLEALRKRVLTARISPDWRR